MSSDYEAKQELERVTNCFRWFERNGFALSPLQANSKIPLAEKAPESFHSCNPTDWLDWHRDGHNLAIHCAVNGLVAVDIDPRNGGCQTWAEWQARIGHYDIVWTTPSGGAHVLFRAPVGIDLAQRKLGAGVDTRFKGYLLVPPSVIDGRRYMLVPNPIIHEVPGALVEHLTRVEPQVTAVVAARADYDPRDVAGMVAFLNEYDLFEEYSEWTECGMALRADLGDAGFEIWFEHSCDDDQTRESAWRKWQSFDAEPKSGAVTLRSLMRRAHTLGWHGTVRKTIQSMFKNAELTASMSLAIPGPSNVGMPMLGGQQALCNLAAPMLAQFIANTADRGAPRAANFPTLPDAVVGHGLYAALRESIARIVAMAENGPKLFKFDRESVVEPLAVLQIVHLDTFDAMRRFIAASFSCELPDRKIKHAAAALSERVDRTFVSDDAWQYGPRGDIESDNPDNVAVFLGIIGCELRFNRWLEKVQIVGGNDPELTWASWTYVDDTVVAKLRNRAMRTKTRFRPAKEFLWDALLALAHKASVDPVVDRFAELESAWDGTPRLDTWLSTVCGVPDDAYHRAVGRNIIGGMVRRARKPGCKHDTVAVLFGAQGTGKSTLAKIIAIEPDWFSDSILLGDASKELVLSLAGKLVVEISEMGMRNSATAASVKAMVTREVDAGRTAYARSVSERPRRNIFIGTTNDGEPLADPTGNRRFLPVCCDEELDLVWLRENITQIVAEAAALEAAGDDFAIPRAVWGIAAKRADAARSESDIETMFTNWFGETSFPGAAYVVGADLVELCRMADLRGSNAHRSAIMRRLGFRRDRAQINGKQVWVWLRGPACAAIEREAVRYAVATDGHGRPRVAIRMASPPIVPLPPLPLPPLPVR